MSYTVISPESMTWLYFLLFAGGWACLGSIWFHEKYKKPRRGRRILQIILGGAAFMLFGAIWTIYQQAHARVILTETQMEIDAGLYSQTLPLEKIDFKRTRLIDLNDASELQPAARINGTGTGEMQAGWFRLQNGRRAYLIVTDRSQPVLYIPAAEFDILLSLQNARDFVESLQMLRTQGRLDEERLKADQAK